MSKHVDLLRHAIEQVTAFWRAGQTPNLREIVDSYLCDNALTRDLRREMFYELIRADMAERWHNVDQKEALQTAEGPDITKMVTSAPRTPQILLNDYLAAIPEIEFGESELLELIKHEYSLRHRSGAIAEIDEYVHRYGHMEKVVRERLSDLSNELMLESSIRSVLHGDDPLTETCSVPMAPEVKLPTRPPSEPQIDRHALAEALKLVCPFSNLSKHVRNAIASSLTLWSFQAGDILLRQGDAADSLLIVLQGAAEVTVEDEGKLHLIARLGPHTVIGEIGLLTSGLRSANVVAATPGAAATISREDFQRHAVRYPRLSIALSELISQRVGTLTIDVLCGKTIDRYAIRERLGRGAMGIVYAAWDRVASQPVALKMLRHDLTFDNIATERFHLEAEVVKHLAHTNIVRTYREFSAFGTSFIAMELCDGPSLAEVMENAGPLSLADTRALLGQIALGLECAHRAGIAHRDLKPSNVMLSPDGTAKLVDFGLARSINRSDAELTSYGQVVGTPRYMAPEQLTGNRGDFKSDLFSFGCIAYEMLAGRPLYQSGYLYDLIDERNAWSLPAPHEIHPQLESDIYSLLTKCLTQEPAERNVDLREIGQWAAPLDTSRLLEKKAAIRPNSPPASTDGFVGNWSHSD